MVSSRWLPALRTRLGAAWLLVGLSYWALRLAYFHGTHEQIFSDIADFVTIAGNIREHGYFGQGHFSAWWPPGTPAAIAIAQVLFGARFEAGYRMLVALIDFAGILLVAAEITALTGRSYLGLGFGAICALLKPSLFWQLKLSSEGLAEALLHLSMGLGLRAGRRGSWRTAFAAGAVSAWLLLTRPQYVLAVPILGLYLVLVARPRRQEGGSPVAAGWGWLRMGAVFTAGVGLLWGPWIVRNYRHLGAFVPLALVRTQTLVWENALGPIRPGAYDAIVTSDGTRVEPGLANAWKYAFATDDELESARRLTELHRRWLALNRADVWRAWFNRLTNVLSSTDDSGLSTVPRDVLFPWDAGVVHLPYARQSLLNIVLIEKSAWAMVAGLAGLLLMLWRRPVASLPLAIVPAEWIVPVLTLGAPRSTDALVGLTLFGALYLLDELRRLLAPQSAPEPG